MQPLDVIVPAGGHLDSHFAEVVGTKSKPLISFHGTTMLKRILVALKESGCVNRIALVGTQEVIDHYDAKLADFRDIELGTSPKNILAGLRALSANGEQPDRVLICTCDLPFLTPESVKTFFSRCTNYDFHAPLISDAEYADVYPTAPATFVKLRDGTYTTGCLYHAKSEALKSCISYIEQVFTQRKSKLGMANILGVGFTMKYLLKMLKVADVEARVSELLHCSAKAIPNSDPALAYDIDYIEDYHYALQNWDDILRGKWSPPN